MTETITAASASGRGTPRRPRRSTEEVKRLILHAARESFQSNGFASTRTRDIAQRADVGEKVIYRHFGSKTQLFEAAVEDTVATFLRDHIADWQTYFEQTHDDVRAPTAAFITGLYDVLYENRWLLQAYLSGIRFDNDDPNGQDLLGKALEPLDDLSARELPIAGFGPINIVVTIRAAFGMLLSMAVFRELLFSAESAPSRDDVVEECVNLLIDGWANRSP